MTNHIKKMLRIVEKNFEVSDVTQELIKKKRKLFIYAALSHAPKARHQCRKLAYFKLADSCFKKIEIIVDCFHMVSHMNKEFNKFRVRENKELIKSKEKSQ